MTDDYKTMRVPTDAWEVAQSYRQEHGLTWGQYLRLPVDDEAMMSESAEIDADEVAETVVEKIEQSDYEDFDDWFSPDIARTIAQHVVEDMGIDETRKAAKQAEANTEEIKRQLEAIQGAMV